MRVTRRLGDYVERGQQVTRLEAFVDAAFAFALTMLVISIDEIPGNRAELVQALKGVPAFAASFAVLAMFWWDHNLWSRRFGLDDGWSVLLSLVYVFLALVYVVLFPVLFNCLVGVLSVPQVAPASAPAVSISATRSSQGPNRLNGVLSRDGRLMFSRQERIITSPSSRRSGGT